MTGVHVRAAVSDDGGDIARVHAQSWNEAHRGHVPDALSDLVDVELSANRWRARLSGEALDDGQPLGPAWVAVVEERIVGFASAGPSRDDDVADGARELYALYVLAEHYGTGAGAALLDAALGGGGGTAWVLRDNPRAHAFYAKHGFSPDGSTRRDDRFGEPVHEVRLVRGGDAAARP
ncbi:GNAT family N-acetyltransferase [Microbacterium trichothecenolyticum]|uniref:GNAT superfamily N-acetyltransferase n=1 Tax=Microbacterium trichothecenolyticum TaxID=69370 RepID=A0ABU0TUP5_MICTR|nr:GNAT family N-acetyltransferase [Microbacterium trichothecenolyticum]MDQ1123384.1 GNAT superfamily N-acetyltransferase [Microbacterium trichothecenolyticum]